MHFTLNPNRYRTYSYGPDNEKISSGDGNTGQHVYLDDYEKITKNNVTTEYYFLENDVIVTKKTGTSGSSSIKLYQAVTDNLGSIWYCSIRVPPPSASWQLRGMYGMSPST